METIYSFSTDDVVYLKNLYTGSICEIDEELFKKLSLKEFPYLISEIDKQVPFIHSKRVVEGDELSLYIVTTMSCNLTCSYCFENDKDRKPSLSSEYDGKKIVNFILDELNFKKYKSLDICFTGGEPLYNFQFIRNLCETLDEKLAIPISYTLITNGTIFTNKIMSFLDCHNFAIQVSFDGDEHYHNLERCNRLGKGTYHRIINNLSVMLEKYKNLSIQARVNISKRNYISIQKLFLDLKKYTEFENFNLYFDFVAVPNDSILYIDSETKKKICLDLLLFLSKENIPYYHDLKIGGYCMFKNQDSLTIHANGNLYKCYSLVGNENYQLGSIGQVTNELTGLGSMCPYKDCAYYEFCYGGCPFNTFVNNGKMERDCQFDYLEWFHKIVFLDELGLLTKEDVEGTIQHISVHKIYVDKNLTMEACR